MAFKPNVLNNYESYSYHISFSMGKEGSSKPSKTGPTSDSLIIAETGKTAQYYIESLQLETATPTTGSAIPSNITQGTLVIIEPMGITLFDRLIAGLMQQGWKVANDVVYYLDISFNGWTPDGSPNPRIFRHLYRVNVTDVGCESDQLKTTYTFNISGFEREPLDDEILSPKRQFRSEIKKTLRETMSEFERVFNKTATGQQNSNNIQVGTPDQYRFILGPNLSRLNLEMPIEVESDTTVDQKDGEGKLYYYYGGERIDHAMIKLVSNAKNIAKEMIPNLTSEGLIDFDKTPDAKLLQYFTFDIDTSYSAYNGILGRYQRIYEYTIDIVPRPDLEDLPPNTNPSITRTASYFADGLLEKRYDHLYTGKNTEVLGAKFDFNQMYYSYITAFTTLPTEYGHSITEEGRQNEIGLSIFKKGPLGAIANFFSQVFAAVGFVKNITGFNSNLLETLPLKPVMKTYISKRVYPVSSPEQITSGVSTIKNPESVTQLGSLSFYYSKNTYPNNALINMALSIRGDPYWIDNNVGQQSQYTTGTKMLYYFSKTAEPYEQNTGLPFTVGKISFDGIYYVTNVKSIFANGTFTQELDCVIDNTTLDDNSIGVSIL